MLAFTSIVMLILPGTVILYPYLLSTHYPVYPILPGREKETYITFTENDKITFQLPDKAIPDQVLPWAYAIYADRDHVVVVYNCTLFAVKLGVVTTLRALKPCFVSNIYRMNDEYLLLADDVQAHQAGTLFRRFRLSLQTYSLDSLNGVWLAVEETMKVVTTRFIHSFNHKEFTYVLGIRTFNTTNGSPELFIGRVCHKDVSEIMGSYGEVTLATGSDQFNASSASLAQSETLTKAYVFLARVGASSTELFVIDVDKIDGQLFTARKKCTEGRNITLLFSHLGTSRKDCSQIKGPFKFVDTCGDGDGVLYAIGRYELGKPQSQIAFPVILVSSVTYGYPLNFISILVFGQSSVTNCTLKTSAKTTVDCSPVSGLKNLAQFHADRAIVDLTGSLVFYNKNPKEDRLTHPIFDCGAFNACGPCEIYGHSQSRCIWSQGKCLSSVRTIRPENGLADLCFKIVKLDPTSLEAIDRFTVTTSGYSKSPREVAAVMFGDTACSDVKVQGRVIDCVPSNVKTGVYNITVIITFFVSPRESMSRISAKWKKPVTMTKGCEYFQAGGTGISVWLAFAALGGVVALVYAGMQAEKRVRASRETLPPSITTTDEQSRTKSGGSLNPPYPTTGQPLREKSKLMLELDGAASETGPKKASKEKISSEPKAMSAVKGKSKTAISDGKLKAKTSSASSLSGKSAPAKTRKTSSTSVTGKPYEMDGRSQSDGRFRSSITSKITTKSSSGGVLTGRSGSKTGLQEAAAGESKVPAKPGAKPEAKQKAPAVITGKPSKTLTKVKPPVNPQKKT